MNSEPAYDSIEKSDDANGHDHGLGEAISCGMLTLGAPSILAIALIVSLVFLGVSPRIIEKGMVWLSVPWFALCYAWCRKAHGTKLVIR